MANPRVFFDITIGGSPAGRIVFEVCIFYPNLAADNVELQF
jgi:hypothetical protein